MSRKPIWITLVLLLAVGCVVAGSIAGNKEDRPSRSHSEPSAGQLAEQEFERNLRYEVAEEQLEEEGLSEGATEEAREFAEREHLGGRGVVELGAVAKQMPGRE